MSAGGRRLGLSEVWHPRVQVVNERSLSKRRPDEVEVGPDGAVVQIQRYSGTVSSAADLVDFLFDEQRFEIRVFAAGFTQQEVELVIEAGRTGRSGRFSIVDWAVGPLIAETFTLRYAPDGRVFPGCAFAFEAKRSAAFYIWKVILPLVIVVLLSWSVFWIDPTAIGAQIGVAATSVLALIAYSGRKLPFRRPSCFSPRLSSGARARAAS